MFTGLIDDVGMIEHVRDTAHGRELRIACRYTDLAEGESVAVNGACLTVRECGARWFTTAAVLTTIGRTTIADWASERRVNLERSLRAADRMGGHIVQGHVDGVGVVDSTAIAGDARLVNVRVPRDVAELMVPRGSLTVDGVSLTVNELPAPDVVQLSLIAYTLDNTTLGELAPGGRVHVEADVVGKYVRHLLAPYTVQV